MSANRAAGQGAPATQLSRDLGLFDITMVGVAAMIGAGIFVLTGIAAGTAGPALIVAFALNGVVTLLTAMIYAELGSAIPEAGGGYLWVRQGLPGSNAFFAGWMSWFAHAVAGSLYALGFAAYMVETLRLTGVVRVVEIAPDVERLLIGTISMSPSIAEKAVAVVIALVFIYINYRGASETGLAGNIITMGKIFIIGIFVVSGLAAIFGDPQRMASFVPFAPEGLGGVFGAMGLTYIAYEGYEVIVQTGEEVKDPRRNIPRAVFLALLIVVPLYVLVGVVCIGAVQPPVDPATGVALPSYLWLGQAGELGLLRAAEQFMPLGAILLLTGALFSTTSALNATTYSSTRVSFAMGRDRNLPDVFGRIHSRTRTPYLALLLSGALIIGMAVFIPKIDDVAAAANIMFLLLFMQVNVAVITIRRKYGDKLAYGYLTPFFPYLPIVAIVLQLALAVKLFDVSPIAWYVTAVWLAGGYGIYSLYASKREREDDVTPVLVQERMKIDRERFSVLVPVANPETVDNLLAVARNILATQPGELILLHVITVPDTLPVSVGRDFIADSRPILDETALKAEALGMTPNLLVRVGHRPADAIIDTVEEQGCNFVVMGWRGRSQDPRTVVGSTIDKIVKDSNANVVVVRGDVDLPAPRVLVPIQHPRHGHLMAGLAAPMAAVEGSYIELMHVVSEDLSPRERAARAAELREAISSLDMEPGGDTTNGRRKQRFRIRIETGEIAQTIVEHSRDFDLVMMGASRESWVRRKVWGDKTSRVANRIDTPLMLVNLRAGKLQFNVSQFFQFFWDTEEEIS
ncbi:MAG: amino acid permease [candidate division WS1 bacterium]|jgi:amino acid transporter/nucleotide-binding universal stress UspA family protein|nr:amino acid permease [candidate division WS1 bacterium]